METNIAGLVLFPLVSLTLSGYIAYRRLQHGNWSRWALLFLVIAVVGTVICGAAYAREGVDQELYAAVWRGDVQGVRAALAKGADPNYRFEELRSVLEVAKSTLESTPEQKEQIVRILRAAGAR